MYFRMLHDETSGAVSYLLADLDTRDCVLVDAQSADIPLLKAMLHEHQLRLCGSLRTHEHAPVPTEAVAALADLESAASAPSMVVETLATGSGPRALVFGHEVISIMPTPGHTTECLSYLWRDRLFCGDLLSIDTCPDLFSPAEPESLWDSATRTVFTLPGETLLFFGHARRGRAVSSVLEQRRWHPWFAGATRDEFLSRVRRSADKTASVRTSSTEPCATTP